MTRTLMSHQTSLTKGIVIMEEIRFDIQKVAEHLRHSANSKTHKAVYGDQGTKKAGLWWVKDEGSYIMSNGTDADRPAVVYAKGLTPKHRDDVEMMLGGDDFAEFIPFDAVRDILTGDTGAQIAQGRTGSLIFRLIYSDFDGEFSSIEIYIKLNAVRAKKVA